MKKISKKIPTLSAISSLETVSTQVVCRDAAEEELIRGYRNLHGEVQEIVVGAMRRWVVKAASEMRPKLSLVVGSGKVGNE